MVAFDESRVFNDCRLSSDMNIAILQLITLSLINKHINTCSFCFSALEAFCQEMCIVILVN